MMAQASLRRCGVHGVCMVCAWCVHGVCMVCACMVYALHLGAGLDARASLFICRLQTSACPAKASGSGVRRQRGWV